MTIDNTHTHTHTHTHTSGYVESESLFANYKRIMMMKPRRKVSNREASE